MSVFEGGARREIDKASTDTSLELLATLAYAHALSNDEVDILEVEKAIISCRQLKIEETGAHRILPKAEHKCVEFGPFVDLPSLEEIQQHVRDLYDN